jgi:hypothetical protein
MNKEEAKIMIYLSDNLGIGGNILEMSKGINKNYGPAYYPNIYNTVKRLEKIGIVSIELEGKNKLIRLDMENPLSIYYMSEAENQKTFRIRISKDILSSILAIAGRFDIFSICALETEKYLKMNRIELLLLIKEGNNSAGLMKSLLQIESDYSTMIDPIILTVEEFAQIMKTDELSPIKEMVLNKYILYNSEGFWRMIKDCAIGTRQKRLNKFPQDLNEDELAYNYNRFGYRLYENAKRSDKISLEFIIFSMSIRDEIRIKYGAIILLCKNIGKINWAYLYYIYKRYEGLGRLKAILLSLAEFSKLKGNSNIEFYADLISSKPDMSYDKRTIKKYVGLYGD